jgi:hypothetical protein
MVVTINFKYAVSPYRRCEKDLSSYFYACNSRCSSFFGFVFSELFPFAARMGKIRNRYSYRRSNGDRRHYFFSDSVEKGRTELRDHYKRINDNVFKSWLNTTAQLRHQVDTFPDSLMPLYVDIISKIKSPGRYHQAKSHLGHEENMLVNQILNDIEISQDDHNKRVANLVTTLNSDMVNTIQLETQGRLHQFDRVTASDVPWYNIGLLYDHLRNDAQNTHEELKVIPSSDENMAELRRGVSNLAAGTEDDMGVLMQIVISFQAEVVPRLRALSTEGIQINDIFNTVFKTRLEPIILHIEDGHLTGKCNFEYGFPKRS